MSPRMFTRFYRPPESILLEPYDEKADIWSMGCLISEVFQRTAKEANYLEVLFDGDSCYPISRKHKPCKSDTISQHDQLFEIIRSIGPKNCDLGFIKKKNSSGYVQSVF